MPRIVSPVLSKVAIALGVMAVVHQTPPVAPTQTGASRFALATVVDSRGRTVVDVGADDFVVREDGADREVLSVRVADYPVAVVLDNSGTSGDFPQIEKAVSRFLERLGPRPVALVTTHPHPAIVASFADERRVVTERLQGIEVATSAAGLQLSGAALAAKTIAGTGALFSTIAAVGSVQPGDSDADAQELIAPIIDSRTVLQVIARQPADVPGAPAPVSGADARALSNRLRSLAEQTHGQYVPIYSAASYEPALDRLAERLDAELLIEYIVPVGTKPVDVQIGVRIPGTRALGLGVAPR